MPCCAQQAACCQQHVACCRATQRNKLRWCEREAAAFKPTQQVARNKQLVARNLLPRNMLRWCKRGLTSACSVRRRLF